MKRITAAALVQVGLDASSGVPLYRQLYEQLREAILSRRVSPGARLPSTRMLAEELGVSRNTVMNAFEQLLAEGYLQGKLGAGTYVTSALPEDVLWVGETESPRAGGPGCRRRPSARGEKLMQAGLSYRTDVGPPRPFRTGVPAIGEFPFDVWERLASRFWRDPPFSALTYGAAGGYPPLREAVASYLREARGVRCDAEQVIIVAGSQQALDLSTRVLLDPGDAVWLEDPGYRGAWMAMMGADARIIPVPVDDEGLDVQTGMARGETARAVYVSPSHQFPLGVTMSLSRRLALLAWANRASAWVLEDDYDSEYRYGGRPLTAIQGLDNGRRVLYLGTFSKVLLPGLRLGYLVAPTDLVDAFLAARTITDLRAPVPEQAVLAAFMSEGHFARHIRRMRALYAERREAMLEAARECWSGLLDVRPADCGMHLVGRLEVGSDDGAASQAAAEQGIEAFPLSRYAIEPLSCGGLLLGYAAFTSREIRESAARLSQILRSLHRSGTGFSGKVDLVRPPV